MAFKKRLACNLFVGAALAACSMLPGAAPARASAAHPVIGFTVYNMTSWVSWGKEGAEAMAKADGATLRWVSANQDVNTQISQIQQFINEKVDVIIVAAVNSSTLGPEIKAATDAGIPVVATNLSIDGPEQKDLVSYIGPNDVGAGERSAEAVVHALHGKGNVVVLQGPIGQSAEIDRTQGIKTVLAKNPGIHLLAIQPANWDRTQAYNIMQDWLSRYGTQIDGVISENDDMAIGAIRAMKMKGISLPVAGTDGIKDGMRAVKNGTEIETNLQDAALELGEAVQVAVDHLQGKPVPQVGLLDMPSITKTNVDHYYDQLYTDPAKFLAALPALVRKDVADGNYAYQ